MTDMSIKIAPRDKEHLVELIRQEIKAHGLCCSLNHFDVSGLTTLKYVFMDSRFNGDISEWDVSNVENMEGLFQNSSFNGDISKWNTSKVWNLCATFAKSSFTGDISLWDTSNVVNMSETFKYSDFQGDISRWNTSRVLTMALLFEGSKFDGNISQWDVGRVEDFHSCFRSSSFRGDISLWSMKQGACKDGVLLHTIHNDQVIQLPANVGYDNVLAMFSNKKSMAKAYLHKQPVLTLAHLEYALLMKKRPLWLPLEMYEQAINIRNMGVSLGLERQDIAHGLLHEIVFNATQLLECSLSDFTMES
jgi:hypothetical protein